MLKSIKIVKILPCQCSRDVLSTAQALLKTVKHIVNCGEEHAHTKM